MPFATALMTAIYPVTDVAKGRAWYAKVFGVEPYFDEPFYVGFNIGGYELGVHPAGDNLKPGDLGVTAYWGVADVDAALKHVLALGATARDPVQDVGGGIRVVTVTDPFGNALGLIENPHFKIG